MDRYHKFHVKCMCLLSDTKKYDFDVHHWATYGDWHECSQRKLYFNFVIFFFFQTKLVTLLHLRHVFIISFLFPSMVYHIPGLYFAICYMDTLMLSQKAREPHMSNEFNLKLLRNVKTFTIYRLNLWNDIHNLKLARNARFSFARKGVRTIFIIIMENYLVE